MIRRTFFTHLSPVEFLQKNKHIKFSSRTMSRTESPIIFAPKTYQYDKDHLEEDQIEIDPIKQFHKWFSEVQNTVPESSGIIPEATTFSTARLPSGRVSSRVVLLKELDSHGFVVYSNWGGSKKSLDVDTNKYASLTFFWPHIQRQVRVEGTIEKVSRETSERYFKTRPRGSKIGAWSSPQSKILGDRAKLDNLYVEKEREFADLKDDEIPCPDFWGGVRILPLEVEFWQGRVSRLHDRISYRRDSLSEDNWEVVRLGP